MKNIEEASFSSVVTYAMTSSDLVYEGTFMTSNGWVVLDITPFQYDGRNLLVTVVDNSGSGAYVADTYWYYTENYNKRALTEYATSNIDITVQNNFSDFAGRFNIKFTIEPNGEEEKEEVIKSSEVPFDLYCNYYISQQLFTDDEINPADGEGIGGLSVRFFGEIEGGESAPNNRSISRDIAVYINSTDLNTLERGVNLSSNQVANFDGTVTFTPGEWTEFEFNVPYQYNGGNIIVTMYDKTGESGTDYYTYFYTKK